MWQQKLAATGVATFRWQEDDFQTSESSGTTKPSSSGDGKFQNPALAAIRASQQLQELASRSEGELNGSSEDNHHDDLHHNRRFKQEDESESSTPETSLKRRISEVSDVELQPPKSHNVQQPTLPPSPPPPIPNYSSATTYPPVLHPSLNHLYPSPPPKRRPDPNEDTIGSDLDDSEDEGDINSEEEGDEDIPLMVCLYEKVHRTKNKWRATMNHGVVCIDGREWVFEKGNGEYEW